MTVISFDGTLANMTVGEEQRAWLEEILAHLDVTATELARRADLSASTLTRFLAGGRDGHTLSSRTIRAIEEIATTPFGVSPKERASRPRALREPDATALNQSDYLPGPIRAAIEALKAGRNAADPWVLKSRALEDLGYLPGDILIVDINEQPNSGDVVCAQIYMQHGAAETVFRLYEKPFIVGAGPDSRKPYLVDNDTVIIRGVVTASFRPRPTTSQAA